MRNATYSVLWIVLFWISSWSAGPVAVASGAERTDDDKIPTTRLVLHPAAAPRPALRYQLLPPLVDRRPGNAAVLYNKTFAEQTPFLIEFGQGGLWEKIEKWLEVPINDHREKELRKPWESFARFCRGGGMFDNLDRAARCESCDWQLPIREQEFYLILLPELQETRKSARLLTTRARLEIVDRKFDDALRTLQTGYALARHVAEGPTLIHGLVALSHGAMLSKRVEDWVQQPGSPNLYWALTWLPRPLVDFRPGLETEMSAVYLSYPELRNVETARMTPQQWQELLDKTADWLARLSGDQAKLPRSKVSAAAVRAYPMAKRALVAWGRPSAEVDAMPVAQVIMVYTMRTYEELRDDIFKWSAVPYPEGHRGAEEAEQRLRRATRESQEALPIAGIVLPAVQTAYFAGVRGDRTIAMLRIVEAIRLYGAAHEGRLPADLDQIKDVPVPMDPATGKPFVYQCKLGAAVLEAPSVADQPQKVHGVRYEIRFAEKGT